MKIALLLSLIALAGCGTMDSRQEINRQYVKTHNCKLYKDMTDSYLGSDGSVDVLRWSAFECSGLDDMVDVDYVDGNPWRP